MTLMGSEIDVLKLRSSLEMVLSIAPKADGGLRGQAAEVAARLG